MSADYAATLANVCARATDEVDIHKVTEMRYGSICYLGVGAINKFDDICKAMVAEEKTRVGIITGSSSYRSNGVWAVVEPTLRKYNIQFVLYSGATPNPTDTEADQAVAAFRALNPNWILAIGGGSPIDLGKAVAILLCYPEHNAQDLMTFKFTPNHALTLNTINTTHGTGTEVDRFSVVSVTALHTKPCLAYDFSYPKYSIDDPRICASLSRFQTACVTVDALAHVTEGSTTSCAGPLSIALGQQVGRLISKYLPRVLADGHNLEARYHLLYASALAGMSFDSGMLHYTHAMEHVLSGMKPEIYHGFGLGMIMPAVFHACWPAKGVVLASILGHIIPGLTGAPAEADHMYVELEKWLVSVGIDKKLDGFGFREEDFPEYLRLLRTTVPLPTLLSLAPVEATDEVVHQIYTRSLHFHSIQN
ncbi:putative Long-chain primary alcohol dehydrogenase AdhA [Paratrimastix pyriformis]|uniref:Long-chain primary alcohol dehydrogenase AdhA n=1 Tax=Paratrimastix pyriformis TaxID=342808 RepID=A0ABQ8UM26_9EUKA|nr:putative Long-chain primary alcohol dehydrogenase AdhA [Paratrimastix pyriformis]